MKFSEKFRVVPFHLSDSDVQRQLVLQADPETPNVVVVHGLPAYASQAAVSSLFARFGPVQAVRLPQPRRPKSEALPAILVPGPVEVEFSELKGARKALGKAPKTPLSLDTQLLGILGLRRWASEVAEAVQNPAALRSAAEAYMAKVDEEARRAEEEAKAAGAPDEDGWVTVSYKKGAKRKSGTSMDEDSKKSLKKRRGEDRADEYLNLAKESKAQRQSDLAAKFEEDRKKLKASQPRGQFNPV